MDRFTLSSLRELAEMWRGFKRLREEGILSSADCADDLDALLDELEE